MSDTHDNGPRRSEPSANFPDDFSPSPYPIPPEVSELIAKPILTGAEIVVLVLKLVEPGQREQQKSINRMVDVASQSNLLMQRLVGDGIFKGELTLTREELAEIKLNQRKLRKSVREVSLQRKADHAENKTQRAQDRRDILAQVKAMRREQSRFYRMWTTFYDWATVMDDTGRYSRKRLGIFVATLSGAVSGTVAFVAALYHLALPLLNKLGWQLQKHV